jgi:hypothetical protein
MLIDLGLEDHDRFSRCQVAILPTHFIAPSLRCSGTVSNRGVEPTKIEHRSTVEIDPTRKDLLTCDIC